jgi:hypothetical protein
MKRSYFLTAIAAGSLAGCGASTPAVVGDDSLLARGRRHPTPGPSPVPTPTAAPTAQPSTAPPSALAWGVSFDSLDGASSSQIASVVAMLSALPKRPWSRIVLDSGSSGTATGNYAAAIRAIAPVSSIMVELVDSSYVTGTSLAAYQQITSNFLAAFPNVDLWEIGNELNGEWLGGKSYSSAVGLNNPPLAKAYASWKLVKAAGKKAALTLYYEPSQTVTNGYDMVTWAQRNFASLPDMAQGLDKVLVSYYEVDNANVRPSLAQWTAIFQALHVTFPNAQLGFGEIGLSNPATSSTLARAQSIMSYYYGLKPNVANWWGGSFWWYGQQDLVPTSKPLFTLFKSLVSA